MPKLGSYGFDDGTQSTPPRKTLPRLAYPQTFLAYGELGLPSCNDTLGRLDCWLETSLAHLYKLRSGLFSLQILGVVSRLA
jgi:hypothetical protein